MKILIAGDFCPKDRAECLFERENFSFVLDHVRCVVSEADYSIVNFECPIVLSDSQPIEKYGPNLKCSAKGMEAVKWAGFNCVTLANNHFYDFGDKGVVDTIKTCNHLEIDYVGGGETNKEASDVLYKTIGTKTLAIINCCEHEFSIATDTSGGSNPLNPIQQYYAIKEASKKADYVLVIVHGGHEHWQLPSPRMVETYRFFVDAGADIVINHHQHCYSGYEEYKGKLIFYGLGNFCFDHPKYRKDKWNDGYMVMINMNDKIEYSIIPYTQCDTEAKVELLPTDAFNDRLSNLNKIITNSQLLAEETKKYYASSYMQYCNIFEPIRNHFYLACKKRGWLPSLITKERKIRATNFVCCEAHRDKLLYWLNDTIK